MYIVCYAKLFGLIYMEGDKGIYFDKLEELQQTSRICYLDMFMDVCQTRDVRKPAWNQMKRGSS